MSLLAAGVLRWRHRLFFVALLVVGMIIAVGPSPYAHPTPLGAIFKAFANSSSAGLALRSTARAVPLVVLALAVLLGLGLNASWVALRGRGQAALGAIGIGVVLLLIVVNLPALFDGSYYGKNLERPEHVPAYWTAATKYLDSQGDTTRVLELPGSDFASYSWGNSVDPITPGLMDRPYVARELIPYGTAGTADLLNAFDRRFQERIADPAGVAALLRRMGIGAVVMRNDIQAQRYNLVAPREINRVIAQTPGLGRPVGFGAPAQPARAKPAPGAVEEDEVDLAAPANEPLLNPVVVYPVVDPAPIVRAESARRTMMIAGDGEGMVTVADVGLLDGAGALQYSGTYPTPAALRAAVAPDATLVVTDENRSRAPNLELGARQRRVHRASGREAAGRRPERRPAPVVPRRAGATRSRRRSSAGSSRSRRASTETRSATRPRTGPLARSTATSRPRGGRHRSATRGVSSSACSSRRRSPPIT